MNSIVTKVRAEVAAGGIPRDDGEIDFYVRVNSLLRPDMTLVDYGCGRGAIFSSGEFAFRERLAKLQGKVNKVVGLDVDDAIFQHPFLDERFLIDKDAALPLDSNSVDIIVAHWVFEHVENPAHLADEFFRVLKPGGWVCARTPHRWGHVGLAVRLVPQRLQRRLLATIRPGYSDRDKFDTVYKINTLRDIRRHFPDAHWRNVSYGLSSTPRYHFNSQIMFSLISMYQHYTRPKTDIMVLLQKTSDL